ncbi:MAG: O-antigen ligase family protein [Bacteroidetes bacterium]|nr:O-antigen ligase family protein [Bacteroidota bacterium]
MRRQSISFPYIFFIIAVGLLTTLLSDSGVPASDLRFPLLVFSLVIFIIFVFQTTETQLIFLMVVVASPTILGLGSGLVPGLNLTTALQAFLALKLASNLVARKNTPVQTHLALPLTFFLLVQILSYFNGFLSDGWSRYGTTVSYLVSGGVTGWILTSLRAILFPWLLYNTVIYAKIDEKSVQRLINIFLAAVLVNAFSVVTDWFMHLFVAGANLPWNETVTRYRGFLQMDTVNYLLPMNILIARVYASAVENERGNFGYVLAIVLLALAAISGLQRILIVAVILSLPLWIIIRGNIRKSFGLVAIALIFVFLFTATPIGDTLVSRYNTSYDSETGQIYSSSRLEATYPMGLAYWRENPLLGIGFGQMQLRFDLKMGLSDRSAVPHNVYLSWLAESGVIGLLAGLLFFIAVTLILRGLIKSKKSSAFVQDYAQSLLVSWIIYMIILFFHDFLWVTVSFNVFILSLSILLTLEKRQGELHNGISSN